MNFELELKEEKVKPHQVTALHLIVALALAGVGSLVALLYDNTRLWSIPVVVAGTVVLFMALFRNKWLTQPAVNRKFRIGELLVLTVLTLYAVLQQWTPPAVMLGIIALAVLFALFWEGGSGPLVIHIDETGVKLPAGKMKRNIMWYEVEQVLLKFGTLTINCADNRLYQWSVKPVKFDSTSFAVFCKEQVEQGKTKRDANNW